MNCNFSLIKKGTNNSDVGKKKINQIQIKKLNQFN